MKKEGFKKGDILTDLATETRKVRFIRMNIDGTFKGYDINQSKELNGLSSNLWLSMTKKLDELFKEVKIPGPVMSFNVPKPKEEITYDFINPDHYKTGGIEVIEMMEVIWGKSYLIAHCEMTAFKYRMRAGKKPDQPIERDLDKANWYEKKAMELRQKK